LFGNLRLDGVIATHETPLYSNIAAPAHAHDSTPRCQYIVAPAFLPCLDVIETGLDLIKARQHRFIAFVSFSRVGEFIVFGGKGVDFRLLLEEMGSLTIAECLSAIREGRPMPTLASLILQGFLEIDLDDALISPETQVRRIRG
jgi:hypothetical protein